MEGLGVKLGATPVRLDGDSHAADWVLCRLGPSRDVGRRVMVIVLHGLPAFHCLVLACALQRLRRSLLCGSVGGKAKRLDERLPEWREEERLVLNEATLE